MGIDWLGPLIGFASGVGISVITALVSAQIQRNMDKKKRREAAAFRVYMQLLELNDAYFWIASSDLRGGPRPREVERKVHDLAWRIADDLREVDDVPYMEEILALLMSEDAYSSANERARALDALLDKLGGAVNPRYQRTIRCISRANVRGLSERPGGHRNNAPGLMSMF